MSSLSAVPAAALRTHPETPCVLIVDDVTDNRTALSRRFIAGGFEIAEADCGADALTLIEQRTPDVVLLGVMMPDMSGAEALRRIREKFSASLLPVIMMTPSGQAEDVIDAMKIGANDYVTKPVDFSIALARVNNQVARRRAELELGAVDPMPGTEERELPPARLLIVDDIAKPIAARRR
jgi:DNA-binding response OmpR family regulator